MTLLALVVLGAAAPAPAQHHDGHHGEAQVGADALAVPTGLTAEEVEGLLEGQGMGLAKPAELHSYPGPLHVLELADSLGLSDEQRAAAEAIRAAMLAEARDLGDRIVANERALDDVFAQGRADAALVDAITEESGLLRGRLRAAHLRAHLAMRDVLTEAQVAAYDRLRGHTN
ncbi:MAG: Spy/CpxP family protein refolding chaperone [Rubricoccaceae bacterium]|nr:Spy/CpxP family protein refolding chaperone [Rubricoccaceae bacterium]